MDIYRFMKPHKEYGVAFWFDKFCNPIQMTGDSDESHSDIMLGRREEEGDEDIIDLMTDCGFVRVREWKENLRIQLATPSRNKKKLVQVMGILWDYFPHLREKPVIVHGLDEGFYSRGYRTSEFRIRGTHHETLTEALTKY